jgi:hypothetical protein
MYFSPLIIHFLPLKKFLDERHFEGGKTFVCNISSFFAASLAPLLRLRI